ncbi:RNA cytidine acetyltransferase [Hypsibius exemplaris]|uniref:RNA cytidine acetyltransferase n=1 Tax=Hypsibius exemplaris TaxID=2072580 RepID=A0A1W0WMJ8_HYPEX|nr:RNA cytidine acetyltransferase [Hypsibius exemplaris]
MDRKKIDGRIKKLIEHGVATQHRSLIIIVGDKARDQIPILHYIQSKASVKAQPSVLWCYKKELGFSTNRAKRKKRIERDMKIGGKNTFNSDDPFEHFVSSTTVRYCYYAETHKILGNTFGMCVLQDFEAITPNILARTIETTEGGGIVALLFKSVSSLKQLYAMTMDTHSRYRTEAHQDVVPRFNERFILSLGSCQAALVMDDKFNILPISKKIADLHSLPFTKPGEKEDDQELKALKESLHDTQPIGSLISCTRTVDQGHALLQFVDAITEKTLRSTVTLTAARGRGKSAALGLAIAAAVAHGYSNIFVTSPSPENLKTLFDFVVKGFDALGYHLHTDYDKVESSVPDENKAVVRLNIFRNHRQTVQYILPTEAERLGQAELVVIDEAAAIPLPLVKALIGPYLVFMASTINGYEGTGRALSLKLIAQLRQQSAAAGATTNARKLRELELKESIRYKSGDPVESWLNDLLCLSVSTDDNYNSYTGGSPTPNDCELYYINRDTLFCYHKASEEFLQRVMALFVASHYKNSPNDLQMLSDAPAHHIFCLLGPVDHTKTELPEIYCVIQVCLEGAISKGSVTKGFSQGSRASGDLIPWTVAQQFQDNNFPSLSGARVIRIAVHPNYQGMGYGSKALQLIEAYYGGLIPVTDETAGDEPATGFHNVADDELGLLEEKVKPRKNLPPLLYKLSERRAERIEWLGTSFGLTSELLKFWKRSGYVPVYLRQTANELTGENSCIMLKTFTRDEQTSSSSWLREFFIDFRRRFISLLAYHFKSYAPHLALNIIQNYKTVPAEVLHSPINGTELQLFVTKYDLRRLDTYSRNMADYHLVTDLLPVLSRLLFMGQLGEFHLSAVQTAIMVGLGLQHKSVDDLAREINLPSGQLLGLYNKTIRKFVQHFTKLSEQRVESTLKKVSVNGAAAMMTAPTRSLEEELQDAADDYLQSSQGKKDVVKRLELDQYKIAAADTDLESALGKRKATEVTPGFAEDGKFAKKKKKNFEKNSKRTRHAKKKQ